MSVLNTSQRISDKQGTPKSSQYQVKEMNKSSTSIFSLQIYIFLNLFSITLAGARHLGEFLPCTGTGHTLPRSFCCCCWKEKIALTIFCCLSLFRVCAGGEEIFPTTADLSFPNSYKDRKTKTIL